MLSAIPGLCLSLFKGGTSHCSVMHTCFLLRSLCVLEIACQVPSASWSFKSPESRISTLNSCQMLETQKGITLPICLKLFLWHQGLPRGTTIYCSQMKMRFVSTLLSYLGSLRNILHLHRESCEGFQFIGINKQNPAKHKYCFPISSRRGESPGIDKRLFTSEKWNLDFHVSSKDKWIAATEINCHYIYWNLENN